MLLISLYIYKYTYIYIYIYTHTRSNSLLIGSYFSNTLYVYAILLLVTVSSKPKLLVEALVVQWLQLLKTNTASQFQILYEAVFISYNSLEKGMHLTILPLVKHK